MSAFFSPYRHEFVRVGACVPQVAVAEPAKNGDQVLDLLAKGDKTGLALMVFPELGLSAYAIDDLLFQDAVLDAVVAQIARLITASKKLNPVFVVGAPLRWRGRLYNCGVVIHRGRLLGIVPKVFLPNYREFYERRHFTSGEGLRGATLALGGQEAPFGIDLLFAAGGPNEFTFHVEICEDLWVPQPPSALGAPAGDLELCRAVERFPFVPADPAMLADNCYEAYNIQIQGLAQRLASTGLKKLVIGVSGGLDSTQALIVSARVMDRLGLPRGNVLAYTLPGFATSAETKANAWRLMQALGVTGAEIDIRPAANQMLGDIGHASAKGERL